MYRIGQEEIDAVARAIMSRDFFKINNAGHEVLNFEKEWAETIGTDYVLTMFLAPDSAIFQIIEGSRLMNIVRSMSFLDVNGILNRIIGG